MVSRDDSKFSKLSYGSKTACDLREQVYNHELEYNEMNRKNNTSKQELFTQSAPDGFFPIAVNKQSSEAGGPAAVKLDTIAHMSHSLHMSSPPSKFATERKFRLTQSMSDMSFHEGNDDVGFSSPSPTNKMAQSWTQGFTSNKHI